MVEIVNTSFVYISFGTVSHAAHIVCVCVFVCMQFVVFANMFIKVTFPRLVIA